MIDYLKLSANAILEIVQESRRIFSKEKPLLEIASNSVIFVGDIHGDLTSATKIFRLYENTKDIFVFLGDYVDRGTHSTEVITGLLRLKIQDPDRIILLRGNHETVLANEHYGFLDELLMKYPNEGLHLYREFNRTFAEMPIACTVNNRILCLHGGIPRGYNFEDIKNLKKGDIEGTHPLLLQILWNDPDETIDYFTPSYRGLGIYMFGKKAFEEFMKAANLEILVRAHTYLPYGAKWFFNGKLLSLFSPTNYVGKKLQPKIAKFARDKIVVLDLTKLP